MSDVNNLNYIEIAQVAEIPENSRIFLEVSGIPVVVVNLGGTIHAFGDVCTHDNGPLGDGDLDGFEIKCPRHGARFDIRTGNAIRGPAFHDIPVFPVKIENGSILLGITKQPPE